MDHSECIEVMNDLVQINNDRITGYEKAINELKDEQDNDLKVFFRDMVGQSRENNNQLAGLIQRYNGEVAEGSTVSGKLYRAWMDVKAVFTGGDRKTVLDNCEDGEDAAQKAYDMALDNKDIMPEVRELVSAQKAALLQSHDRIKALRDSQH